MYDHLDCGVSKTLQIIGGKWTILIVRDLLDGPRRFSELEHSLEGISPRTLTIRLKELEQEGILRRNCDAGPSHPIYELTAEGRSLSDVVQQLRTWGETHTVPSISA